MKRVLIANRGEIACRIAATARRMGIGVVAIANAHDANARHTRQCDQLVRLEGDDLSSTYLNGAAIVQAALGAGADAIHPGYGFLSEDPNFANAVQQAGLIWVGPSADAIRAMGLKDKAKDIMQTAGVPVVPGYLGADQSPDVLAQKASEIGYPVLIKAVAGGGGKGMRLVDRADDFQDALTAAKSEAANAFGNDHVLIEKFIQSPRHIEVQIFGDGTDAVHLYERDCSLQRRHQKVIEEAPAPNLPAATRQAMCDAAVTAATSIGYSGAGTVEFIVDGSGAIGPDDFFFMEMNTRLQVEHPVTEEILGIDLVDWQLRVAMGQGLPVAQADIVPNGHAIEARLYAEDPFAEFMPSVGRLAHLTFGGDVRIDTGVDQGDVVTPHFDPMIAKLIAVGDTRAEALITLRAALRGTHVAGLKTNRDFLTRVISDPDFDQAHFDTGLIERKSDSLMAPPHPSDDILAFAAVHALGLPADHTVYAGFTIGMPLQWHVPLRHGGDTFDVRVRQLGARAVATIGGTDIDLRSEDCRWIIDTQRDLECCVASDQVTVFADETYCFDLRDPLASDSGAISDGAVIAPMPGLIVDVNADLTNGTQIAQGEMILTLEAMKMQHILRAPVAGVVTGLTATTGDQVTAQQVLAVIEAAE